MINTINAYDNILAQRKEVNGVGHIQGRSRVVKKPSWIWILLKKDILHGFGERWVIHSHDQGRWKCGPAPCWLINDLQYYIPWPHLSSTAPSSWIYYTRLLLNNMIVKYLTSTANDTFDIPLLLSIGFNQLLAGVAASALFTSTKTITTFLF